MFKYKTINIILISLIIVLIILYIKYDTSLLFIVGVIILYSFCLFLGAYFIKFNFYLKSINSVKTDKKEIAITFDDGPNREITPKVLELLAKHNIKASFFCIGTNIEKNKDIILEIEKQGHIIGNHSYSHYFLFDLFSTKKMSKELSNTNKQIEDITGKTPVFFRPPYGVTNPNLNKAIKKNNLISIGWSIRSLDTVKRKEQILDRVKKRLKNGDIILFHDNDIKIIAVLENLFEFLIKNGYRIVNLDELLKIKAYAHHNI
ncbi:MAG: polysaccharide deacetylase family protein [Bacteroidales bacterium]|nr:polysaccharide deacetylase family protein [Bacteroidales bacterium]